VKPISAGARRYGLPVSGDREAASLFGVTEQGPTVMTGGDFGPEAGLLGCVAVLLGSLRFWCTRGFGTAGSTPCSTPAGPRQGRRPCRDPMQTFPGRTPIIRMTSYDTEASARLMERVHSEAT
jgi:hypothetical protein